MHTKNWSDLLGVTLQTKKDNWPLESFNNATEVFLHALTNFGPQSISSLQIIAPHLTAKSTRATIQLAFEEGTIRPVDEMKRRVRITNKGRWVLRNYWGWQRRYTVERFPDEAEDDFGMLVRKPGRPKNPRRLTAPRE